MLFVSVSKHAIERNHKTGRNEPPFEIRKSKVDDKPLHVNEAVIKGTVRLVYNPKDPLISGAVCWLEIDET